MFVTIKDDPKLQQHMPSKWDTRQNRRISACTPAIASMLMKGIVGTITFCCLILPRMRVVLTRSGRGSK